MMDKLEKVKQGKIDPNQLLKSLTRESPQTIGVVTSEKNENSRIATSKPHKEHKKTEGGGRKTEEEAKRDMNSLI